MKAIERLKQYIDFKGFTNSFFEKKNNLSNGYIATQLKRNADLGESIFNKILDNCLDLSPIWLLTGQGSMLKEAVQPAVSSSQPQENDNEVIALLKENNATLKDQLRDKEKILTFQEERIKNLEQEILNLKKQTKSPSPASFMAKKPL